jgi:TatD DNase family protein
LPGIADAHCHLQDPAFDADRAEVLSRAADAGVERLLVPGYDVPSSRAALALATAYPDRIHAAVGVHPHYADRPSDSEWDELAAMAREPGVVAVGEIGLDFFRNLSSPAAQSEAFARQLAFALVVRRPVIVHDREAHRAVGEALLAWAGTRLLTAPGVLHAFSGDESMAARLAQAGYLISFALPVAFRSAAGPRAAAAGLAEDRILVETDSPWLAPGGSGARNEPTTVLRVAAEIARLRGTTPQAVALSTRATYDRLVAGHHKP